MHLPSVTTISSGAFFHHYKLEELYITSQAITSLPAWFLQSCYYLNTLSVPFSGTGVQTGASSFLGVLFNNTTSIGETDPRYLSSVYSGSSYYLLPKSLNKVIINRQTTIPEQTFHLLYYVREIELSEATTVGQLAFYNCDGLKKVKMDKVTTLGDRVFEECDGLETLTLPSVTIISEKAFYRCRNLHEIVIHY